MFPRWLVSGFSPAPPHPEEFEEEDQDLQESSSWLACFSPLLEFPAWFLSPPGLISSCFMELSARTRGRWCSCTEKYITNKDFKQLPVLKNWALLPKCKKRQKQIWHDFKAKKAGLTYQPDYQHEWERTQQHTHKLSSLGYLRNLIPRNLHLCKALLLNHNHLYGPGVWGKHMEGQVPQELLEV